MSAQRFLFFLTGFSLLRRFPIDQGPLDINVNSDPRLLKRRGNDRIEATTENTRTLQIRGHEDNADCRWKDTADERKLQMIGRGRWDLRGHCRSEETADQKTLQIRRHCRSEDTADQRSLQVRGHCRSEVTSDERTLQMRGHCRWEDTADYSRGHYRSEVTADHRSLQWLAGDRSCTQKYETYRKYLVDPRLGVYLELFLINAWWSSRGIPWLISNEFSGSI